ncbi:MAG: hypothetical protein R3C12_07860 [Planctomycetaceae bacterium]
MNIPEKPTKAVVSVVEMANLCLLSRSRFFALIQSGVFPKPVRNGACKRPVFDLELQQKCLDIRRTGIGLNGPVLFNRKAKAPTKKTRPKLASDHADLLDALKSLGLQTTAEVVDGALRELFPSGWADVDEGQRVRQVFLHLQRKK